MYYRYWSRFEIPAKLWGRFVSVMESFRIHSEVDLILEGSKNASIIIFLDSSSHLYVRTNVYPSAYP